jgi:hypothetical protein
MLNITIDNSELEDSLKQTYGNSEHAIASAFAEFIQHQQLKQDIGISIRQLDAGESIPLKQAIHEISAKYE